MPYFDFQGHRVYYTRDGAGDPIIFLPNATLTGRLWEYQAEHFTRNNDVIVVDLPGFGRSDRARPSLGLYIDWLRRFVDELDLAPVALVGNCIGSLTALHYAVRRPEAVRALVLINTLDPDVGAAGIFKRGSDLVSHPRLRPALEAWFRHMPHPERRHPPYWRSQFGSIREPRQQAYLEHARRCWAEPETRLNWLALGFDPSNEGLPPKEHLADLPPVCWIWGRDNKILPYDVGKKQLDVLAADEVHVIDGRGYAVAWEDPDELNRIIENFLDRHPRIPLSHRETDVAELAYPYRRTP